MAVRQDELTGLGDDVDLARDRMLVERCQAGDATAFGNLYARYYDRLLRFCLRRLHDPHEAEDAAQEAFARAWRALPRFAGERRFYPWLTVIAGNICTDMLRRRSRSTPTDEVVLAAQHSVGAVADDTSEELVLATVDGELVHRALGRLSDRHRHVLALREGSGWTYQEIADHEGVGIGTIETLLWRARQALRRELRVRVRFEGRLGRLPRRVGRVLPPRHRPCRPPQLEGAAARDQRPRATCAMPWPASPSPAPRLPPPSSRRTRSPARPAAPPASAGAVLAAPPLTLGLGTPAGAAALTAPVGATVAPASSNGAPASDTGPRHEAGCQQSSAPLGSVRRWRVHRCGDRRRRRHRQRAPGRWRHHERSDGGRRGQT